ncbi:N-acetylglucosaminyltransferase [Pestalotiopsis sp. 9143b]|nr:N-acetylglucosaminyltransferase [Pestalotiopsis sp. 9143b]
MAPTWGFVDQLSKHYGLLPPSERFAGATSPESTHQSPPSLGQILLSKRLRYAGTALAALGLFVLALRNYDSLPSLETLKSAGYGAPTAVLHEPMCPVAATPLTIDRKNVDWSRFAYTQYVTNPSYLCNSVMIFETLFRLGSKADRVMMYPREFMDPTATESQSMTEEARLLVTARDKYKVKLQPVEIQHREGVDATWAESFTKLLAFNQTQYERVLNVDSDSTILQTMDELFLLPPCPVAMPKAYWLLPDNNVLSSQLLLVQPNTAEFDRVMNKMHEAGSNDYDMEIVNQLYINEAMILPHRPYDLLTGEFRSSNHGKYLGSDNEVWDPVTVFNEAKFLHFSDWPIPKPWVSMMESEREEHQPKCVEKDGVVDCSDRELWNGFYIDFTQRRKAI